MTRTIVAWGLRPSQVTSGIAWVVATQVSITWGQAIQAATQASVSLGSL